MNNIKSKTNNGQIINPESFVDNIFHISDIHIRLYERQKEFKYVFKKLYKKLNDLKNKNSLIVITGDLLHNKIELSPESIAITKSFLTHVGEIAPTVVIAGNHDLKVGDKHRLDGLTPLVKNIKNVTYLKDTGIYRYGKNIRFSLLSVFDYKLPEFDNKWKNDDIIDILLYHGSVNNSINNFNFKFTSCKYSIKDFKNYDYILLGDIHKHQFLSQNIAYSGSLLQNNFGEHEIRHGMIHWDLYNNSENTKFIPIENNFIYKTIKIDDNFNINEIDNITNKKVKLKIINENSHFKTPQIKNIIKEIKKIYNCTIIRWIVVNNYEIINSINMDITNTLNNLYNPNYHIKLFKDFLILNNEYNKDLYNELINYHKELFNGLENIKKLISYNFNLVKLNFNNMFCFGENNSIDFTNVNNINGLIADNHSGKSYIIEIIMFMLYDISDRANKGIEILNKSKDNFKAELIFTKHNEKFKIVKRGIRKNADKDNYKEKVRVEIDFYKYDLSNNEWIQVLKDSRKNVAKKIRELLPDYNVFKDINISLQFNHNNFINMTNSTKHGFLNSLFNIDFFKMLYDANNKNFNKIKVLLEQYDINKSSELLKEYKEKITNIETELKYAKKLKENQKSIYNEYNKKLTLSTNKLKEIQSHLKEHNINEKIKFNTEIESSELLILIEHNNETIHNRKKELEKNHKIIKSNKNQIDKLKKNLIDETIINEHIDKINNFRKKIANLKNDNVMLQTENKYLSKSKNIKYDKNCEYCMQNPLVSESIQNAEKLNNNKLKIKKNDQSIFNLIESIDNINVYAKYKEDNKTINNKISKLNDEILNVYNKNNNIHEEIDQLNNEIDKCNIYIQFLHLINEEINYKDQIKILSIKVKNSLEKLNETEEKINDLDIEFAQTKDKIINITKDLTEYESLSTKYNIYENYKRLVDYKAGIPLFIIKKILPIIESKINDILSLIVDFNVKLRLNEDKIDLTIVYNEVFKISGKLISGFEKTIFSIVFKTVIIDLLDLPKFIFIDEALSSFDQKNYNNMKYIIDYLRNKLNYIFIITHQQNIKTFCDSIHNISKDDSKYKNSIINI